MNFTPAIKPSLDCAEIFCQGGDVTANQEATMGMRPGTVLVALVALVCMPVVGWAETATEKRLRTLEKALEEAQKEIERLREDVRDQKKSVATTKGKVEKVEDSLPEIDTKGKLELRSKDGDFVWRLGGRVQADAALYQNDQDSGLGSGSEFRRARLEMGGTLWRAWDFMLQYDFTDTGEEGIRDAFIRYTGFKPYGVTGITAGQFKEPFSLEELTSSKYITFMERALPNVFAPARNRGASVSTAFADMVTGSVGFFGEGVDSDETDGDDNSEGYATTGRLTFSPIHTATQVVHLGAAGSWRAVDEADMLRFRQRPESHVTDVRLVNTDFIDADDFTRFGGELAGVYGPFSLQGEYMRADVNRQLGGENLTFDGWYVYGTWFLTGESRAYEFDKGAFGNIKPTRVVGKGGIGAWELAARYSALDLNDDAVLGGEQRDITLGLNWYPNSNLRFLLNYVRVLDIDEGPADGAAPDVAQVRAQVHW
jgi:phosphate-selective porin OprO/OprP